METTMHLQYNYDLGYDLYEAVEIAMHGDQMLMEYYVRACCVKGLTMLLQDIGPKPYTPTRWGLLNEHLERARRYAKDNAEIMTERFAAHSEPPF